MRVGIVGWRGMVGSVLVDRMRAEGDFAHIDARFYSTSAAGRAGPDIGRDTGLVLDANDIAALSREDVILTAQGGDYTSAIHGRLRATGWNGYWIDAASTLRMEAASTIVSRAARTGSAATAPCR